jgi:hypothetical protein
VVVLFFKAVQLKDELAIGDQSLIGRAAVCTLTAKQLLVPAAAFFDVVHCDEWLGTHSRTSKQIAVRCHHSCDMRSFHTWRKETWLGISLDDGEGS